MWSSEEVRRERELTRRRGWRCRESVVARGGEEDDEMSGRKEDGQVQGRGGSTNEG